MKALLATSLLGMMLVALSSTAQAPPPVNVITWHNDNYRTGQNTNEMILTTGANGNVTKSTFGLLCKEASITGQVYAQPLVVGHANGSMTVYVATMQDYVYAFAIPAQWKGNCQSIQPPYPRISCRTIPTRRLWTAT